MKNNKKIRKKKRVGIELVKEVDAGELISDNMAKYGYYVIEDRAIPRLEDGLKPVHRHLMWAAHSVTGARTKFVKSATIVGDTVGHFHPHGDCLDGDTLVYSLTGDIHKIKDLARDSNTKIHVLAYEESTGKVVPSEATSFRVGQRTDETYTVVMNDGSKVVATSNHPFYIRGKGWVEAKNLVRGMLIFGGLLDTKSEHASMFVDDLKTKSNIITTNAVKVRKSSTNEAISDIESSHMLTVKEIVVTKHDEKRDMYDFSGTHENMLIPTVNSRGETMLILVHNSSVYDAMVRMTHDRCALFEGKGSFGGQTSKAAAYRYTEARLSAIARVLAMDTEDLHVVPTMPNFADDLKKPIFLPMRLPTVLLNANSGIAVGVTCNIPPHNISEVMDALRGLIKNKESQATDFIKAPDYGEGTIISSKSKIKEVYETGEGTLEYECKYVLEDEDKKERKLVVTGYCPEFKLSAFMSKCALLQADKSIIYVRNESSKKNGVRVVVGFSNVTTLHKEVIPALRKKINYKFNILMPIYSPSNSISSETRTTEEVSETCVKIARCSLNTILTEWLSRRKMVVKEMLNIKRSALKKERERERGKRIARKSISKILKIIKNGGEMISELVSVLDVTQFQAECIASMRIDSLQKSSQERISAKIKDISTQLKINKIQLTNINDVILEQINDIEAWVRKNEPHLLSRGTKIRVKEMKEVKKLTELRGDIKHIIWDSSNRACAIDVNKKSSINIKSIGDITSVCSYRDTFLVVYADGNGMFFHSEVTLSKIMAQGKVVGIIGDIHENVCLVMKSGKIQNITFKQKTNTRIWIELTKVGNIVTHAFGFDKGDHLGFISSSRYLITRHSSKITVKRIKSIPWSVMRSTTPFEKAFRIKENDAIINIKSGAPLQLGDYTDKDTRSKLAKVRTNSIGAVSNSNVIVTKLGRRTVVGRNEAITMAKRCLLSSLHSIELGDKK